MPVIAHWQDRGRSAAPLIRRADVVAALSLVAAALHFWVLDPHFREWWAYGVFFVAAGVGQMALAVLILRRTPPWLVLTGIVGNVAIVGMYVLSRTNGPPFGPHAGRPEAAGVLDLACAVAELGVIVALLGLLPERLRRRTATLLGLIGLVLWTARIIGVLL
jgi:hypothetical protein